MTTTTSTTAAPKHPVFVDGPVTEAHCEALAARIAKNLGSEDLAAGSEIEYGYNKQRMVQFMVFPSKTGPVGFEITMAVYIDRDGEGPSCEPSTSMVVFIPAGDTVAYRIAMDAIRAFDKIGRLVR